ncbi:transposase [Streptomyces lasalocidi]
MLGRSGDVTGRPDVLPEHRPGHGGPYGDLNRGCIEADRLRALPAGLPLPRSPDGRLVLAIDVSARPRPDTPCSAERLLRHGHGRNGRSSDQFTTASASPPARCWSPA